MEAVASFARSCSLGSWLRLLSRWATSSDSARPRHCRFVCPTRLTLWSQSIDCGGLPTNSSRQDSSWSALWSLPGDDLAGAPRSALSGRHRGDGARQHRRGHGERAGRDRHRAGEPPCGRERSHPGHARRGAELDHPDRAAKGHCSPRHRSSPSCGRGAAAPAPGAEGLNPRAACKSEENQSDKT